MIFFIEKEIENFNKQLFFKTINKRKELNSSDNFSLKINNSSDSLDCIMKKLRCCKGNLDKLWISKETFLFELEIFKNFQNLEITE